MSDFHNKIEEATKRIHTLIENKDSCPKYMSGQQLESILEELDNMDRIRDKKVFSPYYPKVIVDSWDYRDALATQLMDILELYNRL